MLNMKDSKLICLAIILLGILAISPGALAIPNSSVTVDVGVSSVSEISISPSILTWSNINPGQTGTTQTLSIKNIGSLNVTDIHAFVDTLTDEGTRPYGSGNASAYAAGGVIVFRNETDSNYYFAGRLEWNSTEDVSYKDLSVINTPVSWGFFRNTSYEYFWGLGQNSTAGDCNDTGAQFAISDIADNGSAATRTPLASIDIESWDSSYGYFSISSGPLAGSCVAASYDCKKIYIYKYDKRSGFTSCLNSRYIQSAPLAPNDVHSLTLSVYIPLGIPGGSLSTSTFTVYAA